jgi:hypothetical protein
MQVASTKIEDPANRKYVYRKYVKRLVEAHKLLAIRKGLYAVLSSLGKAEKCVVYPKDTLIQKFNQLVKFLTNTIGVKYMI